MTIIFNLFPLLAKAMRPACQTISSDTARFVEAAASANAPVRTGWMAGNVYSVTPKYGSTYGQAGPPPTDDVYLLPEQRPAGPYDSVVGCAANYSEYVELGTRYMGAQPFFYPAIEQGKQVFPQEGAKLEALLLANMG